MNTTEPLNEEMISRKIEMQCTNALKKTVPATFLFNVGFERSSTTKDWMGLLSSSH